MTSRFSGDIFYSASSNSTTTTTTTGVPPNPPLSSSSSISGSQSHHLRQHHPDLQIYASNNKRSLITDFQNYPSHHHHQQQQILNLQLLQHQQQQQQGSVFQQQYLMRSVKPRTGNYRFGLPVYHHQQLPTLSSFNLSIPSGFLPYPNLASGQFGLSNLNRKTNPDEPEIKILSTLQELEKELLNDDEDENQEASVITTSEWSDTLHNLMGTGSGSGSGSGLDPDPTSQGSMSTSGSNNNINNNGGMISPSPTSSTSSSCCSTSASPTTSPSIKQLITEAAEAISDGKKVDPTMEVLTRLSQLSNPKGTPEQRLGFYMCHALRSRACPNEYPPKVNELYGEDQRDAMYKLFDVSPCFKFGILAANNVMVEAITSSIHENVNTHIIDFNMGHHRGQYMHLLRALGSRAGHVRHHHLRITVVDTTEVDSGGGCKELVKSIKDELLGFAEGLGVRLSFNVVTRAIHELTRESLGCEENESVVVNFAYVLGKVSDESVSMENLRDELLRRVKRLGPRAVTLVEQEMNVNTAPFLARVNESCAYFGALFDALGSGLGWDRDSPDRARVEEGLGRMMSNVVACEGRDRVERAEVFGKWRARMGMAGFEMKPLGPTMVESMRVKLNSGLVGHPGFCVSEESGGVGFGWMGRTLTVASSWR